MTENSNTFVKELCQQHNNANDLEQNAPLLEIQLGRRDNEMKTRRVQRVVKISTPEYEKYPTTLPCLKFWTSYRKYK